jgi:hypothetical protein
MHSPEIDRYREEVADVFAALPPVRRTLRSLDQLIPMLPEEVQQAQTVLTRVSARVDDLRAPRELDETHLLLQRGLALALRATTARLEAMQRGDHDAEWNAASAAAGALLMLDRARDDLGIPLQR